MTNPVAVVRREVTSFEKGEVIRKALLFWCPGCDCVHRIVFWQAEGHTGPVWQWDGNLEAPTVNPSIKVEHPDDICHSYLHDGRWRFLSDCTHSLAGQTVEMVPLPDWLVPS